MATPSLKERFLSSVDPRLAPAGFARARGSLIFVRKRADFSHHVYLLCVKRRALDIRVHLGIRCERIEQIFHRTSGFAAQHQKTTATIGGDIGDVCAGAPRRSICNIQSADEIPTVADEIETLAASFAEPYFGWYSNLKIIDAVLNDAPRENSIHRGGPPIFRCSYGLIAAKLVGRANYDELVTIYRETVARPNNGFYLPPFNSLVDDLAVNFPV